MERTLYTLLIIFTSMSISAFATPEPINTMSLAAKVSFPVGTIVPFAGRLGKQQLTSLANEGWLICNGREVNRKKYKKLFAAIGDAHGRGDAIKTFNLPDYRGRFLRGVDGGAGRDPDAATRLPANVGGLSGDAVGSVQADAFKSHNHRYHNQVGSDHNGYNAAGGWEGGDHNTGNTGGNETRPKNANVNWLIFAGK